jgi:hypothetical protein
MARSIVMAAPVLTHGTRIADHPGGFPAVMDGPPNERGEVYCNYGLRDAMLLWLDERLTREHLGFAPRAAVGALGEATDG